MRVEELFCRLARGEFVEDEFDRNACAGDQGLTQHDSGVCLNQPGLHNAEYYKLMSEGCEGVEFVLKPT